MQSPGRCTGSLAASGDAERSEGADIAATPGSRALEVDKFRSRLSGGSWGTTLGEALRDHVKPECVLNVHGGKFATRHTQYCKNTAEIAGNTCVH